MVEERGKVGGLWFTGSGFIWSSYFGLEAPSGADLKYSLRPV